MRVKIVQHKTDNKEIRVKQLNQKKATVKKKVKVIAWNRAQQRSQFSALNELQNSSLIIIYKSIHQRENKIISKCVCSSHV